MAVNCAVIPEQIGHLTYPVAMPYWNQNETMKKITRNPKLIKERNKMIHALYRRGFYLEDIGEIFRLQTSRIHQIISQLYLLKAENKKVDSAKK